MGQIVMLYGRALTTFGSRALSLSRYVDILAKMLDDPSAEVRSAVVQALGITYQFVGAPLKDDLAGRGLRVAHLKAVFDHLDTVSVYNGEYAASIGENMMHASEGPTTTVNRSERAGSDSRSARKVSGHLEKKLYLKQLMILL